MKQFFVVLGLLGILGCSKSSKDDPGEDPGPGPGPGPGNTEVTITTIQPSSAERVPITINGTGFSTTAANNTVWIGGLPATVTKATATSIEITLPENLHAGDHDVRVSVNNKSATKTNGFHLVGWFISNFAGSGTVGSTDGTGDAASFTMPSGIVTDSDGNFYVPDGNRIRKISAAGVVTTFASRAGFGHINAIAIDRDGNLYVTDELMQQVKKITAAGIVSDIAGKNQTDGDEDGIGEAARFWRPYGVAINAAGTTLYVSDQSNNKIKKIDLSDNQVTTIAGDGEAVRRDGVGLQAGIPLPGNLAFDADGDLIITEKGGGKIRRMKPDGTVSTVGGFDAGVDHSLEPTHLTFDRDKNIYVTFSADRRIRKYEQNGTYTIFAGAKTGPADDNGPANVVQFQRPEGIALKEDGQGNKVFYVVDSQRRKIKKISKQ